LHFRIIKRASDLPKRTQVGHFLRLRQAGPQNASNSILKRKQRNLLDNSPYNKEAQSRIRQASTPNANKRSTDSTYRQAAQTREGKRETDKAYGRFAMTSFAPEEFTPEEFFGGAKFVRNFDTAYHDVTPIKLDSRPHYELRSTNAINK